MLVMMLLASMVATKDTDLNQKVRGKVVVVATDVVMVVSGPRVKVVGDCNYCGSKHPPRNVPCMDRYVTIVMARIITVMYVNPGLGHKVKTVAVTRVNKIGNLGLKQIKKLQ